MAADSVQQPPDRLNKQIRRRSDVVGMFPNREAVFRLVGALLVERHDERAVARLCLSLESPALLTPSPTNEQPMLTAAA